MALIEDSSLLSSITEHTGIVLPTILLYLVFLTIKYHDRVVFTKPNREGLFQPKGYPLVGNTLGIIGRTDNQLEKMLEVSCRGRTIIGFA